MRPPITTEVREPHAARPATPDERAFANLGNERRPSAPAAGADTATPPGSGPVVLVAEDNEINWTVAKALLAQRGIRSELAPDGLAAVRMACEHEYAAVLMDCQMPLLDGYEATARIREAERERRVPIIAMTAHAAPGERERCLAVGMDDYLAKPVRVEDLAAVIARWIGAGPLVRDGHGSDGSER